MDLDEALSVFEAVDANLKRLDAIWGELQSLIPKEVAFNGDAGRYDELALAFDQICNGLPAIEGWRITARPWTPAQIIQNRMDAPDVGELSAFIDVEDGIFAPGTELTEYRFRAKRERMNVVRAKARELIAAIDGLLRSLPSTVERDNSSVADLPGWQELTTAVAQLERLVADTVRRTGRWGEMRRHMGFAQGCDLHDIAEFDWPTVKQDIEAALYDQHEPVPVEVDDLRTLVASRPSGPVSTALAWELLAPADFERLLLNVIQDAPGYENPRWLTRTNAPDRGRDLSVERVIADSLPGSSRRRASSSASTGPRDRSLSQS